MNLKIQQTGSQAIVYDADCIQQPSAELFDENYWRLNAVVSQTAPGRGQAVMVETEFGPVALRAYRRGGLAARFSRDRYLFTGFDRSRPLAEVRMLAELRRIGLPVPQPIAGLCQRRGLTYVGVLLTRRITPAVTLAESLGHRQSTEPDWWRTGRCIRRFHDAGVVHADLNARNILLGEHGGAEDDIFLIDFDRAFFSPHSSRLFRSNLDRLHRSLSKLWPPARTGELRTCWGELQKGYNSPR